MGREMKRERALGISVLFDFIDGWIGGCGMKYEQRRFSAFAGTLDSLFCFPVCNRLRSSRGVPGVSPTCTPWGKILNHRLRGGS